MRVLPGVGGDGRFDYPLVIRAHSAVPLTRDGDTHDMQAVETRNVSTEPQVEEKDEPIGITFQPDIYDVACAHLPADRGARVLDLGAGQGYVCKLLRDRGYDDVHACDLREEEFKIRDVPFRVADLNDTLPYEDDSFDCVITLEVAEHVEHHDNYFRELLRVTRPGGRIILSTPNVQDLGSRLHFLTCGLTGAATRVFDPAKPAWYQHVNLLSLQQMLFYIEHNGGTIERIATNRFRNSALVLLPLYPLLWLAALLISFRKRNNERGPVTWRYHRLAMSLPALLGRITFLIARA